MDDRMELLSSFLLYQITVEFRLSGYHGTLLLPDNRVPFSTRYKPNTELQDINPKQYLTCYKLVYLEKV